MTSQLATRQDPILMEIVGYALVGAAEEMKLTLMRSAYNPIIYEVLDFSCGVFDRRGRLTAQASGLAIFLGTLDWAVQSVIARHGVQDLREGDVFLTNDPYGGGGTHLNDVCCVTPVFSNGELIGFTASRAHWTDVGGAVAMSVQPDAPNLHAEGLVLPGIRLYRAGDPVVEVFDLLRANIRDADRGFGDLRAQLAAGGIGGRRLIELAERYGAERFAAIAEQLQEQSEARVRTRLALLPEGETSAVDQLDDDGHGGPPVSIRARLVLCRDRIRFDFTGTDAATASGYNASLCSLVSAARVVFKALTDPSGPTNDGSFRPLEIHVPEGTVVSATYPTGVSLYGEPSRRAIDAVWRAFAELVPDVLPAGHYGTIAGVAMAGWDDRSEPALWTTFQGPNPGGWGGGPGQDGESALFCVTNGDTRNTPAEIVEHIAPLRVHALRLRDGSGGAGRWRGGLGVEYDYEILTSGPFALTCALGRTRFGGFGVAGGADGAVNALEVRRNGRVEAELERVTAFPLRRGDHVVLKTGGGGGYGIRAESS
jgi:N-methylhydantoinase B